MRSVKAFLSARVLFPFLFPVFYSLRAFRRFFPLVSVADGLEVTAGYLLGIVLFYSALRLWTKDKVRTALILLPALLFYFFWSFYFEHISRLLPASPVATLGISVLIASAIIIGWARISSGFPVMFRQRLLFFSNTLILCYLLAEIILVVPKITRAVAPVQQPDGFVSARHPSQRLSVFFIIFDEYASSKALNEYLSYDNSALESFLKDRGFSIQSNSISNYNLTLFSVASMLNASYYPGATSERLVDFAATVRILTAIRNNSVTQAFVNNNYHLNNYSVFEIKDMPRHTRNGSLVFATGKDAIRFNTFWEMIRKQYRLSFSNGIHIMSGDFKENFYDYNEQNIQSFLKQVHNSGQAPQFSYLHVLSPHEPYFFNKNGQLLPADSVKLVTRLALPEFYTYNIDYANRRMKDIVSALLQDHPHDAVIIIMGDHGWRSFKNKNATDFLFRNFNAVYFPDRNYSDLYDSISNVNTIRVVLNKVLGTTFPMLPDSTIRLNENHGQPGLME